MTFSFLNFSNSSFDLISKVDAPDFFLHQATISSAVLPPVYSITVYFPSITLKNLSVGKPSTLYYFAKSSSTVASIFAK